MLSNVTVSAVAAPLVYVSALFALVFVLYGIPRAARIGQGTVWISVLLCVGHVGLAVVSLMLVAQDVNRGIDPPLFPNPPQSFQEFNPLSDTPELHTVWATLVIALIWYTMSIIVFIAELRAGRPRGRRRAPSSSE